MVDDPQLRAEAARIRDKARSMRAESQRHSKEPNYKLWRVDIAQPLLELRDRVKEELVRKTSKRATTPSRPRSHSARLFGEDTPLLRRTGEGRMILAAYSLGAPSWLPWAE